MRRRSIRQHEPLIALGLREEGREPLQADGTFEVGAVVVLVKRGNGVYCTVMDARGRVVRTPCAGLVRVAPAPLE
jgi:hypothetical protein